MENQIMDAALDIFLPVMESATVLAAHYARACGRDVVLAEDMRMGLMFAARNVTGKQTGTLFPEDEDEDEGSESGSWETVDDEELTWVRYSGEDEMALKMNECADTWDTWVPETPAERAIKNAVEKANQK